MPNKLLIIGIFSLVFLLLDWYIFQAVKTVFQHLTSTWRNVIYGVYWSFTGLTITALLLYNLVHPDYINRIVRNFLLVFVFANFISKFFALIFVFTDDLIRLGKWIVQLFTKPETKTTGADTISRSEFLAKTALVAGTIPLVGMTYGIISGAHDYRIRRQKIILPNLPQAFQGLRIAQISDIHSGSFFNKTAVRGGVEMLLREKPDLVFFTGDLVNNVASEIHDYFDVFNKIKAPLGVYSTLGNHDYGDYVAWDSPQAKMNNLKNLMKAHELMGWDLLMDENRSINMGSDQIALLGVQNWGAKGRFPKYGNLAKAHQGTQEAPVKILLSHDPSHWDGQVNTQYKDIDLMLAGHTHGMQFGVEVPSIKWSPVQYIYKQWGGLYQQDNQYLYVNRGFGYIGFPGRVGMPPEITIIELIKS